MRDYWQDFSDARAEQWSNIQLTKALFQVQIKLIHSLRNLIWLRIGP